MHDEFYDDEPDEVIVHVSARFQPIKLVAGWHLYDHVKDGYLKDFRGTVRIFKNELLARQLADFLNSKET